MQAFRLYENTQANDSDGWMHWIHQRTMGYFMTRESANRRIEELLLKKQEQLEQIKILNPHITNWKSQERAVRDNFGMFLTDTARHKPQRERLFDIEPIHINQ